MLPIVLLVVLLAAPAVARAGLVVPDAVVPGTEAVVRITEDGLEGGEVRLLPDAGPGAFGRVVLGALEGGEHRFVMPSTYACTSGCTGERPFVPGQLVRVSVCSVPVAGGDEGILTSSIFCLGGTTVVARARVLLRGRVEPRRAGRLVVSRWSAWGSASARARGVVGGRRATAVASEIAECRGRLWYSTVVVRQDGRTVQTLRDLAPC